MSVYVGVHVYKGQVETDKLTYILLGSQNLRRQNSTGTNTHIHINMALQCHLQLLGLALMAQPLRNGSIDRLHTRWNLSICHNLVSCLRPAYKQTLIEWSQLTKTTGVFCGMNDTDVQAEGMSQQQCTCIFIKFSAFFVWGGWGSMNRHIVNVQKTSKQTNTWTLYVFS